MATHPLKPLKIESAVIDWLLESDPAIRWQVLQDLLGAPADEVAAERARVASEGWGAQLLSMQGEDGSWGGVAWNQGYDSTMHVLMLLRDMGLDPVSPQAQRALALVRERVIWQWWNTPFFAGETEPCINGQMGAAAAYFRQDIRSVIDRLLTERLDDGGWNCEAENGSTRSSFNTTICVLEALLEYERQFGSDAAVTEARRRGEEYLLERRLFKRKSTGEVIDIDRKDGRGEHDHPAFTEFAFPTWWHYDVLRGLEYFRHADTRDERLADAIELVESKRQADGRWLLDAQFRGTMPVDLGESIGQPSKWNTLRALRVLNWYAAGVL